MPSKVAILYHPRSERAIAEAAWLESQLRTRRIDAVSGNGWDEAVATEICCDRDLVVVLGGDGTIIRAARFAAPLRVPILGINLGRVGFLADLTPDSMHYKIDAIAAGEYWIEERAMLEAECRSDSSTHQFLSLNEVAVARGAAPRAVHVRTLLDGSEFTTFTADGMLVATATGSTAYSLAAGGPILYPESRDFLLTPVAPHLHIGRTLILPGETVVTLCLDTDRPAVLSIDGTEPHEIGQHDTVIVRRSNVSARFARLEPRTYYYAALADRLR